MNLIKFFTLTLLIFSIFDISAQEEDTFKGWKYGISLSPEIAFRTLKIGDSPNYSLEDLKKTRDSSEIPCLSGSAGLFYEYRINHRHAVKAGLHYSLKGVKSRDIGMGPDYVYPGYGSYFEKFIYSHQYHYIGIPISESYYFLNKSKIQAFFSLGLSLDFLYYRITMNNYKVYNADEETVYDKELIGRENPSAYNRFNPSLMLSTGIDWKCGKRSTLRIEPIFRGSTRPLLDPEVYDLKQYNYNLGVNFNYVYSLN